MEEKVLVKSERYNIEKMFLLFLLIGLAIALVPPVIVIENYIQTYDLASRYYYKYGGPSGKILLFFKVLFSDGRIILAIPGLIITLILVMCYFCYRETELTVTDKRIYGKVAWGKRVDLPIDSVSATGTIPLLKGVSVSTSSGRISFYAIKNTEDIYKVINNLLLDRQKKSNTEVVSVHGVDAAGQLKKYKELLDSGVITQEEFEAKKKELLGL